MKVDVYETERAGVQRQTEGVFEAYTASDFGGNVIAQRSVSAGQRYNNQFGTKRSGSSNAASRVKEYIFEKDEDNVTGKASRELDTEYLSAVESGDMETVQRMVDEAVQKARPKRRHRQEDRLKVRRVGIYFPARKQVPC